MRVSEAADEVPVLFDIAPPRKPLLPRVRMLLALVTVGIGVGLGLGTFYYAAAHGREPKPNACGRSAAIISSVMGWSYFAAWSASFYPQLIQNFERKSVSGLSFDYAILNVLGFACYSTFNLFLFFSPSVRAAYEKAHAGHHSAVRANDVFFALHALVLSAANVGQIWYYPRGGQRFSRLGLAFLLLCVLVLPTLVVLACIRHPLVSWLTVLYALSYVKLGITIVKYIPQVSALFMISVLSISLHVHVPPSPPTPHSSHATPPPITPRSSLPAGCAERAPALHRRLEHRQRRPRFLRRLTLARSAAARRGLLFGLVGGERRPRQVRPGLHLDVLRHRVHGAGAISRHLKLSLAFSCLLTPSHVLDAVFMAQHWICYRASRHGVQTSGATVWTSERRDGHSGGVGALFAGAEQREQQSGRGAPLLLNSQH